MKKAHGGDRKSSDHFDHLKTGESLAADYGVGQATIRRDGQFARAVEDLKKADPTIEQQVHSGKVAKQSVVAAAKVMAHSAGIYPNGVWELRPSSITQCIPAGHESHLRNDRGRHGYMPPGIMIGVACNDYKPSCRPRRPTSFAASRATRNCGAGNALLRIPLSSLM